MHVARRLTEETGGVYGVALSEVHLDELLSAHAPPPPSLVRVRSRVALVTRRAHNTSRTHPRAHAGGEHRGQFGGDGLSAARAR
jgi:hypothetical protein